MVSATDPHGRNLGFLDPDFHQDYLYYYYGAGMA
jgi:hypothetical protein